MTAPATTWDDARTIGQGLFEFAFPPAIDRLLEESRHLADDIRLSIVVETSDDEIAALPWELLYDPEVERFLALSNGSTLVRSSADAVEAPPPERGNLRTTVLTESIDEESLRFSNAIAADEHVDVSTHHPGTTPRRRSHVVVLPSIDGSAADIPARTPFAIIRGDLGAARSAIDRARSVLAIPPAVDELAATHLTAVVLSELAQGQSVEAAVVAARRSIAAQEDTSPLDWAGPILLTASLPGPLVQPEAISSILGRRVMEHTASWVNDTLAGVVTSVILFLVGLVLFRIGFSSSNSFELDILSPISLYQSFSALMIELANYQQSFLLIATGILAVATSCVGLLWWHNREIDPEEASGFAARFAGPLSRLRTLTFLAVATLTVLGSYGYQQYLWRVKLPIPDGALGIAITRAAGADDLADQLAETLSTSPGDDSVVVRQLPLEYDASDISTARRIGRQIGASAVVVYRTEENQGQDEHIAYLVFTDPHLGRTFLTRNPTVLTGIEPVSPAIVSRLQENIAIPLVRSTSISALANASAAIVAYQAGDISRAIDQFEQAIASSEQVANDGTVAFLLANAYLLNDNPSTARQHVESAVSIFESIASSDQLGPQDELTLVMAYLALGMLDRENGDWTSAITWLQKGIAHRDELLARGSGLDRPRDLSDVYARIYGELAASYRALSDREEEIFWSNRANDELSTLANRISDDDRAGWVQLSATRLTTGDCVGAVDAVNRALSIAPSDADALLNAAAVAFLQSSNATAQSHLGAIPPDNPLSVRAHDELGLLLANSGVSPSAGYVEPTLLEETSMYFQAVASPSGLAMQEIGAAEMWKGAANQYDVTAAFSNDPLIAARSYVAWSADPMRRAAAITAYSSAIDRLSALVALRPNDSSLSAALASALTGRLIANASGVTDTTGPEAEMVVRDAAAMLELTDRILADGSSTPRHDRLAALALSLEAMNEVVRLGLDDPTGSMLTRLQTTIAQAQTEANAAIPVDTAEAAAMRAIFDEIYHYATNVERDAQIASEAASLRAAVVTPTPSDQALLRTVCREERDRLAGQSLLDVGDAVGAQTRFESALQVNPNYAPAAIGLANALIRQEKFPDAIIAATTATERAPNLPEAWFLLALAHLGAGNTSERDQALSRYAELLASIPDQIRTANLRETIENAQALIASNAQLAPSIREIIPALQTVIESLSPDSTFQLAARYAELGRLALFADDTERAELLLSRSIGLDEHQPGALTDLAIMSLIVNGTDTSAIDAVINEISAPIWDEVRVTTVDLLELMHDRVRSYRRLYPERATTLQPLSTALDQASAAETLPEGGTPEPASSPATEETPGPTTPVASPVASESYRGEQFGLSFTAPVGWAIADTYSDVGLEGFWVTNGPSLILIAVIEAPGTTLNACLESLHQSLANDPTVSDLRPLTDSAGETISGASDDLVYAVYRYNDSDDLFDDEASQYISCQSYPRPDTILFIQQSTTVDAYAGQAIARETLLKSLVLPESEPGMATPVSGTPLARDQR